MTKWKPTPNTIVRYWHPRNGGWYHGSIIKTGYKWATLRPLGKDKTKRVHVKDIEPATIWGLNSPTIHE